MGIRAEESIKRRNRNQIDYLKKFKITHIKPIFYWLEWEIWDHIDNYKLPYCSLYDEGFNRLGCVICPFHSFREHQKYRERWPKYFVAFEKAMKKVWDKGKKSGEPWREKTFNEFINNWYQGK